jgi:hypothetical protein
MPRPVVNDVCGELAELNYAGKVKAIAMVILLDNGDVRTSSAYEEGQKFPLVAGLVFAQHSLVSAIHQGQRYNIDDSDG